ncbi:unnamed protein product, partial [Mesorhabditis spiculigera]
MVEIVADNPIPQLSQPTDYGIPPPPVPPQQIPLQIPEPEFSDRESVASAGISATTATVIQPAQPAVVPVIPIIPAKPVLPKPTVAPARKGGLFDSDGSDEEDIFAQAKKRVATKSESPFDSSLSQKSTVSSIGFLEEEAEPDELHQNKPSQPEKPKNIFAPSLADVLSATSSLRNKPTDASTPAVRQPQPAPKLFEEPPVVRSEPSISQPAKKSLFDSDDSDDDLFSAAPLTSQKKTTKGLFDSDSDDDLFAAIKRRPVTHPPPKQQTEQPKNEPEQSTASGGRLLPVKAYIGTSERPEKKSTPAQITHKKSLFDDSDSDSELFKKPTKPEPKKEEPPKQELEKTAPETTQQSIVQPTVSPVKVEEKKEQTPEPEAPPPFPKSRSPPATVAKPVEAELEVPPPFLGNREEEALEAPPPFRFEPEEREELPFGPPSFASAAEEPDFPLPIPSDHLLYSPPPFDIDRLSRKDEEKQLEFPAEKDEKEDQPLPNNTTLDDTEEMSGARGKLNNSAFASKLSAALAMPPGGPRPPGAPSSSTSSPASSSSAGPLRRAASEQPPRSPESRLFDEKPSLLSSMAKGRPKGPPRRPPTTRNRQSQDSNSSRPISVTSSRASSTDQKEESAPIFRRNPSPIQIRATKSMVLPSSPIKSDEVVIERKLSNTRISEGGSTSGRKSSTSSSRSSLHGGDEDKKSVTAVQNSPPIVRKGSTGSRISITSQTVKSQDTKEPTQPKKKSLFDSESSDDDLFRGKAASTTKTAPKKASVITTTVTKDNTKPPAGPSSTSTTSRPPAPKTTSTAPKKSLFDDSDDDLDLFRKKK